MGTAQPGDKPLDMGFSKNLEIARTVKLTDEPLINAGAKAALAANHFLQWPAEHHADMEQFLSEEFKGVTERAIKFAADHKWCAHQTAGFIIQAGYTVVAEACDALGVDMHPIARAGYAAVMLQLLIGRSIKATADILVEEGIDTVADLKPKVLAALDTLSALPPYDLAEDAMMGRMDSLKDQAAAAGIVPVGTEHPTAADIEKAVDQVLSGLPPGTEVDPEEVRKAIQYALDNPGAPVVIPLKKTKDTNDH